MLNQALLHFLKIRCVVNGKDKLVQNVQLAPILRKMASALKLILIVRNFQKKRRYVRNAIVAIN